MSDLHKTHLKATIPSQTFISNPGLTHEDQILKTYLVRKKSHFQSNHINVHLECGYAHITHTGTRLNETHQTFIKQLDYFAPISGECAESMLPENNVS